MLTESKEDVTAPGTGLGMSIVKQIVDLSGGVIEVHSDPGRGTEIKLSLPLDDRLRRTSESPELALPTFAPEDLITSVRRRARGRTVTIRGFDNTAGKSDLQIGAIASLKACIVKYAEEWFNLAINSDYSVADIVISDESEFLKSTKLTESSSQLLLILCSNGARRDIYTSQFEVGQLVEFISKPCGPHRLAKALLNILDAEEGLKKLKEDHAIQAEPQGELVLPVVSPQNTRVGAGTSNLRVLGDLKSPISFAPNAICLNIQLTPDLKARETIEPRPALVHRMSSNVTVRLNTSDVSSEHALSELLKVALSPDTTSVSK